MDIYVFNTLNCDFFYLICIFLITAPPSVCVPAVIGALAVCIQNQKSKTSYGKSRGLYRLVW